MVNKRALPDYYEVIKEPIAISVLKSRIANHTYKIFPDYVRDWALMVHNAQTYNRPDAGAYIDALTIKGLVAAELENLVTEEIIESGDATFPDLGEIPPVEVLPVEEEEDDDEEDDEDDEDDDVDDSDEAGDTGDVGEKRKRKRAQRSGAASSKREAATKDESGDKANDLVTKKKRGRPPKGYTPMEARIKSVLKGIRKPKNDLGQIMIHHFEKLPDKATMPEYFVEIKEPIAIELIKV